MEDTKGGENQEDDDGNGNDDKPLPGQVRVFECILSSVLTAVFTIVVVE
jgi:hypothetical protein